MKQTIDTFLMMFLWTSIILLGTVLFVNHTYAFNLLSLSHWSYFIDQQIHGANISMGFYFTLTFVSIIWLVGLYGTAWCCRKLFTPEEEEDEKLLMKNSIGGSIRMPNQTATPERSIDFGMPRIAVNVAEVKNISENISEKKVEPEAVSVQLVRPPMLSAPNINMAALSTIQSDSVSMPVINPSNGLIPPAPIVMSGPTLEQDSNSVVMSDPFEPFSKSPKFNPRSDTMEKVKNVFENAGFIIKNSPSISGIKPSVWATRGQELMIGLICSNSGDISAFEGEKNGEPLLWKSSSGDEIKSPVWALVDVVEKVRALAIEALEDEDGIKITPWLLLENATITNLDQIKSVWNALDVSVISNINQSDMPTLESFVSAHKNSEGPDEAFDEFVDAIYSYFNQESSEV